MKHELLHVDTNLPVQFGETIKHIVHWHAIFVGAEIPGKHPEGWVWVKAPKATGDQLHCYLPRNFKLYWRITP